jgi:hypothetical protein
MSFHARGDWELPTARLRQLLHQAEQALSGRPRLRFGLHGAKLRNDLVVNRDFHTGAGISTDPADQRRQPLARFTDREFHPALQLNILEMYNHVQCMSTRRQSRDNLGGHMRPRNLNPANKYNPDVPFGPLDGGKR